MILPPTPRRCARSPRPGPRIATARWVRETESRRETAHPLAPRRQRDTSQGMSTSNMPRSSAPARSSNQKPPFTGAGNRSCGGMSTGRRGKSPAVAIATHLGGPELRLPAGFGFLELDRRHLARDGEIAVVEQERARHPVIVELERNRVRWRMLPALPRLVEIADRHGPARHPLEKRLASGRIGRLALVRCNLATDDGERMIELFSGVRSVIDRKLEQGLAGTRRRDDLAHVLGRKCHRADVELLVLGLRQIDGNAV